MSGITIPNEPIAVYFAEGNKVEDAANTAVIVRSHFGQTEAAGLLEARYLRKMSRTMVFVAARCAEFVHLMDHKPGWERLEP